LFEEELTGEEEHADWLESQLNLIEQVGVENYLATQIRD
jgi:bacterioferritin